MLRRKRRVRLHQDGGRPSFEGIQLGRRPIAGHYVLIAATAIEESDDGGMRTIKLDAAHIEIPARNVVFVEAMS